MVDQARNNGSHSRVARNRSKLRGGIRSEVQKDLIDVTPAPSLRWIVAFDHRMAREMEMTGSMLAWRVIAATHMSALAADAQMHPPAPGFQTLFASASARGDLGDGIQVRTRCAHIELRSGDARIQILMNGLHHDGSLAYSGCDTLDGAGANVTDGKNAGLTRDEW